MSKKNVIEITSFIASLCVILAFFKGCISCSPKTESTPQIVFSPTINNSDSISLVNRINISDSTVIINQNTSNADNVVLEKKSITNEKSYYDSKTFNSKLEMQTFLAANRFRIQPREKVLRHDTRNRMYTFLGSELIIMNTLTDNEICGLDVHIPPISLNGNPKSIVENRLKDTVLFYLNFNFQEINKKIETCLNSL